jgi:hypothetical protein
VLCVETASKLVSVFRRDKNGTIHKYSRLIKLSNLDQIKKEKGRNGLLLRVISLSLSLLLFSVCS